LLCETLEKYSRTLATDSPKLSGGMPKGLMFVLSLIVAIFPHR